MVLTGHWHQIPGWKLFWIGCWFVVLLQFNKFFLFLLLFLATNLCVKGHYFCWEITNTFFFLLSTEVACLIFLLFFSLRFDGVYFKVEYTFLLSKCWEIWQEKKFLLSSFFIDFFFLEANFGFSFDLVFLLRCMH